MITNAHMREYYYKMLPNMKKSKADVPKESAIDHVRYKAHQLAKDILSHGTEEYRIEQLTL